MQLRRAIPVVAAVVALSACGSGGGQDGPVFPRSGPVRLRPPSPTSLRHSAASNREAAQADVSRLVGVVVVPLGARRVATIPQSAPSWFRGNVHPFSRSLGIATTQRIWVVHEPLKKVVLFVQKYAKSRPRPEVRYRAAPNRIGSRPSRSYEFPPIPGRSWGRWLNIDMTSLPNGSTVVFARAGDQWVTPPPRSALVPGTVRRIDVVSGYGKHPSVLVHLRKRYRVASIVALTNGLAVPPSQIACAATFGGPSVTLRFRAADGRVLARAQVTGLLSGPCNPLQLTVGDRKTVPLIGADLLKRIQRLANVNLDPPTPQDVAGCLHRSGWASEQTIDRLPAQLRATKSGRTWTVTFHPNGKLTTRPAAQPHALHRCLRAGPPLVLG